MSARRCFEIPCRGLVAPLLTGAAPLSYLGRARRWCVALAADLYRLATDAPLNR